VLKNQYHDSVVLMLAAKEIKKIEHVIDAAYMMGTHKDGPRTYTSPRPGRGIAICQNDT